ncbi:MAG: hexose kinase [Nocardioidaceae bacterium]
MIITVTPNPAYDVTYEVARLVVGEVHRVAHVHQRVGGKGINVARVLDAVGEKVVAIALADRAFVDEGRAEGFDIEMVDGLPSVRRTLVLHDADSTTSLWEPGHPASASAGDQLKRQVSARLAGAAGLVVSGSLPPGIAGDLPAQLAVEAVSAGVPVVVDVDDEALRLAAKVPGVVLMPNGDELSRLAGADCASLADVVVAAQAWVHAGVAGVIATLGAEGMVAVTREAAWAARLDQPLTGNPTGAGDAAAAGVIRGLVARDSWPDLLRDAVAMSAAAVLAPVAGHVDVDVYDELRGRVAVDTLSIPRGIA